MEWRIDSLALVARTFDFSSSEGGFVELTGVLGNDTLLLNMIEYLEFESGRFQALICKECGHSHCAPGNWLVVRQFHDLYCFLPDTSAFDDDWERDEYRPPEYIRQHGFPTFDGETYSLLRELTGRFPLPSFVPHLSLSEVTRLIQFSAPDSCLGHIGEPISADREKFVTSSTGRLNEQIDTLEELCADASSSTVIAEDCPLDLVGFQVDGMSSPTWRPFGYLGSESRLNLKLLFPSLQS